MIAALADRWAKGLLALDDNDMGPPWEDRELRETPPEESVLADLEAAREAALGARRKVAALAARLGDDGVLLESGKARLPAGALGAAGYRGLWCGGAVLASLAAYQLVDGLLLLSPWATALAAVTLGGQIALGGSQFGERLRELPARWRRRPRDRRLILGLAMPGALLAAAGAALLVAPVSPASYTLVAVGLALVVAGWLAADPDPERAALVADYESEMRACRHLKQRFARQVESARGAVLERIDKLALLEDNDDQAAAA